MSIASSLRAAARTILPRHRRAAFRSHLSRAWYFGFSRFCPVCRSPLRRFAPFDYLGSRRDDARCPVCGSLERHRLIWLYLKARTDFFDGRPKRMLHMAPELCFIPRFRRVPDLNYLNADLRMSHAMEKIDLTQVPHPDNTFDVVLCSHVIQHIPDDQKAIRELLRVLKPGGWAILHEGILGDRTVEDPAAITPEDRRRVYGDPTSCRRYGADFKDRLESCGFRVRVDDFGQTISPKDRQKLALDGERFIHLCSKP
jgi:SAM-dependent methyltransferase